MPLTPTARMYGAVHGRLGVDGSGRPRRGPARVRRSAATSRSGRRHVVGRRKTHCGARRRTADWLATPPAPRAAAPRRVWTGRRDSSAARIPPRAADSCSPTAARNQRYRPRPRSTRAITARPGRPAGAMRVRHARRSAGHAARSRRPRSGRARAWHRRAGWGRDSRAGSPPPAARDRTRSPYSANGRRRRADHRRANAATTIETAAEGP